MKIEVIDKRNSLPTEEGNYHAIKNSAFLRSRKILLFQPPINLESVLKLLKLPNYTHWAKEETTVFTVIPNGGYYMYGFKGVVIDKNISLPTVLGKYHVLFGLPNKKNGQFELQNVILFEEPVDLEKALELLSNPNYTHWVKE
jgi:hypothetical protein